MNIAQGKKIRARRKPPAAQGVMLIEALVAVLIFAFGVLGLVGLQATMTKAQSTAKYRADAAFLAQQVIGTMWSDAPNLASYATANCAGYARCGEWAAKVASTLPGGTTAVTFGPADCPAPAVKVAISWTQASEGQHTFNTCSTIVFN
jgi:type IV pilus assembly protein PilV